MSIKGYHRGKVVMDDDHESPLFQPIKGGHNQITWGKPAMFVQAKLNGECPRCSTNKKKGLFQTGFDEDVGCSWAYCHVCGYRY